MDYWDRVIDRNRELLSRIVATLFALAGIADGAAAATLPRHRHTMIRRILRTAESAVRRLVIVAAHRLAVIRPPVGAFMYGLDPNAKRRPRKTATGKAEVASARIPPFRLTDPVKRFSFTRPRRRSKRFPRMTCIGLSDPKPIPGGWHRLPDDEIDAAPLGRRLAALKRALDDLDGQARRLIRWQARRDRAMKDRPERLSPMRIGRPPGHRKRKTHEVDEILANLHSLARHAIAADTS